MRPFSGVCGHDGEPWRLQLGVYTPFASSGSWVVSTNVATQRRLVRAPRRLTCLARMQAAAQLQVHMHSCICRASLPCSGSSPHKRKFPGLLCCRRTAIGPLQARLAACAVAHVRATSICDHARRSHTTLQQASNTATGRSAGIHRLHNGPHTACAPAALRGVYVPGSEPPGKAASADWSLCR